MRDIATISFNRFNRTLEDMDEERNKFAVLAMGVLIGETKEGNASKSLCCRVAWYRFSV